MQIAGSAAAPARPAPGVRGRGRDSAKRLAWVGLAMVLAGGLALRLWGVKQGLPYAYNTDEGDHFVPHAVSMFGGSLNPYYFANPPAFTYLLHWLFAVAYGGGSGVKRAFALHPEEVYILARVAAAVLGTLALWLLYLAGSRLFGRGVGLLAAAIEAVAFLPVFYAHLALNDVPTLAPLTLSLLGTAGVLAKGRTRDYALAGVGLGLACATKYTAGIVLLPLLGAVALRVRQEGGARRVDALLSCALAGALAVAAFVLANPYSVLDYSDFHRELVRQSTLSAEAQGKLGAPRNGGISYYLWSLTWGLGWVPTLAALGGGLAIWRRHARIGLVLVPAPLMFLVLMGTEGRYFGRWLMPILPLLCLLAAFFIVEVFRLLARAAEQSRLRATAARRLAPAVLVVLIAVTLAQGLVYSIHSGIVLSRADTRNLTRAWMLAHVPAGTAIVAEPVSPDEWAREVRAGTSTAANRYRWAKYASLLPRIAADGTLLARTLPKVTIEDYERTLAQSLLGYYRSHGYCVVVSGSTQSGRAYADQRAVPLAIAYYQALAREGEVIYRSSPYRSGARPVAFNFDWSFDYYPLAYARPGPEMTLYRLHGGRCAR